MTYTRSTRLRRRVVWSIGASLLGVVAGPAAPGAGDASADPCSTVDGTTTCTFPFTGAAVEWTAPAGLLLTPARFTLAGADGGRGRYQFGEGGRGGEVAFTRPLTAGEVLVISVGGRGTDGQLLDGGDGGFGGGGTGGESATAGGGGGGATRVDLPGTDADVVAGGGGGGADAGGGAGNFGEGGRGGDAGSPGGSGEAAAGQLGRAGGGAGGGGGRAGEDGERGQDGTNFRGGAAGKGSTGLAGSDGGGAGGAGGGGGGGGAVDGPEGDRDAGQPGIRGRDGQGGTGGTGGGGGGGGAGGDGGSGGNGGRGGQQGGRGGGGAAAGGSGGSSSAPAGAVMTLADNQARGGNGQLTIVYQQPPTALPTATAITSVSPAPSLLGEPLTVGFSVTTVAGVPDPSATGTVTVTSTDGASCQAPVADGQCDLTPTRTGDSELSARYAGDPLHAASTSPPVQHEVLAPAVAATFTSPGTATFRQGDAGDFLVRTTGGQPTVALASDGALPDGVTFTDLRDGTGRLAGTPAEQGRFTLTFTATSAVPAGGDASTARTGQSATATQQFALVVPPALVRPAPASSAAGPGTSGIPDGTARLPATGAASSAAALGALALALAAALRRSRRSAGG